MHRRKIRGSFHALAFNSPCIFYLPTGKFHCFIHHNIEKTVKGKTSDSLILIEFSFG